MGEKVEPREKACRHLGEMVEQEAMRKLTDRYASHGVVAGNDLERALTDVEWMISDFERSPSGPSTRNALVLALVRRVCVDRLRGISRLIALAIDSGTALRIEDLGKC